MHTGSPHTKTDPCERYNLKSLLRLYLAGRISVIKQHTTRTTLKKRFPHLVTSSSIVIPQARKFLHKHSLFSHKYRCFQRRFLLEAPWRVQQVSPAFHKAPHWHLNLILIVNPEKSRTPECT
uniref:(northern house mosquito) hypothetical protein n=1 Tax=Culex pipiens TaxID=7175 RepID=A0A8D8CK30_CULPI